MSHEYEAFCRRVQGHRLLIGRMLKRRLHHAVRTRMDVEDVMSAITGTCPRNVGDLLQFSRVRFLYWLRLVARRRLYELQRFHLDSRRRNPRREASYRDGALVNEQLLSGLVAPETSQDAVIEQQELRDWVNRSLAGLSASDQQILRLRYFEDLVPEQIASRFGISLATCQRRIGRAKVRLKRRLEKNT